MADKYRFPLENQDEYQGTITFTALKEERRDASKLGLQLADAVKGIYDEYGTEIGAGLVGAGAARLGGLGGLGTAAAAAAAALGADKLFKKFEDSKQKADKVLDLSNNLNAKDLYVNNYQPISGSKSPKSVTGSATLYLPTSIQINDGIGYDNINLGVIGEATRTILTDGKAAGNAITQAIGMAANSYVDFFKGTAESPAASLAAQRAGQALGSVGIGGGSEIAGAIGNVTGVTINPNTRTTLRSVSIRNFSFQFKLIPRSKKEADEITRIIKFFRSEMYPESFAVRGVNVGYNFPNKFEILLNYKNKQVATKILPSYLQSFQAVYNPNSMSFTNTGDFPEVDISMTFVEERTLNKQDIVYEGFGY